MVRVKNTNILTKVARLVRGGIIEKVPPLTNSQQQPVDSKLT
jgi:hypothetical protein